jgi:hypothetical protein
LPRVNRTALVSRFNPSARPASRYMHMASIAKVGDRCVAVHVHASIAKVGDRCQGSFSSQGLRGVCKLKETAERHRWVCAGKRCSYDGVMMAL